MRIVVIVFPPKMARESMAEFCYLKTSLDDAQGGVQPERCRADAVAPATHGAGGNLPQPIECPADFSTGD